MKTEYRMHECSCGHTWEAERTFSAVTSNLSGEPTPRCEKCNGADGAFVTSSPVYETPFWATIPMAITYVGEILKGEWQHDLWRCELSKARESYHAFDYKTGLGLRKRTGSGRELVRGAWRREMRPVKPSVADVLHSLLFDAEASNMSFSDWCSDYGYDDDSLKALNIYKACCETAVALRKYLTREQIETARKLTEDM